SGVDHDLRIEGERRGLGIIKGASRRAAGLLCPELDQLRSLRHAGFVIENQSAGLEMHWVLHLLRRRLVGMRDALGISLQINLYLALRADHVSLRIVFELRAGNLVEAVGVASVNNDLDVVQLRATTSF